MSNPNSSDSLEVLMPESLDPQGNSQSEEWNELEYYLINIGTSVGIGSVWRFSYLMYQGGGGAFLIPFLISSFMLGQPALTMLISLGQENSIGLLNMYTPSNDTIFNKYTGLAITKIFYTMMISSYYIYLLIYNFIFLVEVLFGELVWIRDSPQEMLSSLQSYFNDSILGANNPGGNFN